MLTMLIAIITIVLRPVQDWLTYHDTLGTVAAQMLVLTYGKA
jgi:hypothetical protein